MNDYKSEEISLAEYSMISTEDYKDAAFDFIQKEHQSRLDSSVLLLEYHKNRIKGERQMTLGNLIKLFETMMDKKYENDLRDLAERRRPADLSSYMVDYLIRNFGLKKLAYKSLNQIIPALSHYCKEHNHYVVLMCRLLNVFHTEPVSFSLSLFITKMRAEFSNFVDKNSKNQEACLIDVIGIINTVFDNNKQSRNMILSNLKPENISKNDFYMFHLCYKLVRLGLTPEMAYDTNTSTSKSDITSFYSSFKTALDMKLFSDDDKLFSLIFDAKTTGLITKDVFMSKINFQAYYENCKTYMVSKSKFLSVLIDIYNVFYVKAVSNLIKNFNQSGLTCLNRPDFENLAYKIDTSLNKENVEKLWEEATYLEDSESIASSNFYTCLLTYGIGHKSLKEFVITDLWEIIEKPKADLTDLFLTDTKQSKRTQARANTVAL